MRKLLSIILLSVMLSACEDDTGDPGQLIIFNTDSTTEMSDGHHLSDAGDASSNIDTDALAPDVSMPEGPENVIELGPVELVNGRSDPIEFELPEDIQSIVIIAEGDPTLMYAVEHLEGPDGQVLVAEEPEGVRLTQWDRQISPFPGPFYSPNRSASASTEIATLLAPNNPGVAITPGLWTFQLGAIGLFGRVSTQAEVQILTKTGAEPQDQGVLDLHFHFTGARGWTAENAPEDPDFQVAVERMRTFYEGIGIRLGNMTYDNVPNDFLEVDAGPQGPGQNNSTLHQLFSLNQYETGVALFFVDRIGGGQLGGFIGGISGGTPGPVLQAGTVRSGVAVATAMNPNPEEIGHIMGHETGHYLGLYHTQEVIAGLTDQIPDTPIGQAGNTNLMYPTVTAAPASLTDGQGWVLHRNPAVRYRDEE